MMTRRERSHVKSFSDAPTKVSQEHVSWRTRHTRHHVTQPRSPPGLSHQLEGHIYGCLAATQRVNELLRIPDTYRGLNAGGRTCPAC